MNTLIEATTYDTDNSSAVATFVSTRQAGYSTSIIYRATDGEFLRLERWVESLDGWDGERKSELTAICETSLRRLLQEAIDVNIVDLAAVHSPEASAGPEPIVFRSPDTLKHRIDLAAKTDDVSLDRYVPRRLERPLQVVNSE